MGWDLIAHLILACFLPHSLSALHARVFPSVRTMNASALGVPNQLPQFHPITSQHIALSDRCPDDIWQSMLDRTTPILPYRVLDGYDRSQSPNASVPTIVHRSADGQTVLTLFPSLGGKLASVLTQGRELLFNNPVFQPANLGRLNAWTSGGIEWNWPRLGHSVFTSQNVFVAFVNSTRGPITRVYEFDRELNTTWQVDIMIPSADASSKGNDIDSVWMHVKVSNAHNKAPIDAYWWTNIGAPISDFTRVLAPVDSVVSNTPQGLVCLPFPLFDDCAASSAGYDWNGSATFFPPRDHSYPYHYGSARENFLYSDTKAGARNPSDGEDDTPWIGWVDGDGLGAVHTATQPLTGRKYWVWGRDTPDLNRVAFLSGQQADRGQYFEVQAGVAPTQLQTFPLAAGATMEWTEVLSPVQMQVDQAHNKDYNVAVAAMAQARLALVSRAQLSDMDRFMSMHADTPITQLLHKGSGFGHLFEVRTGQRLSPGLNFTAALDVEPVRPWLELLSEGTFSTETLASAPQSFQVSAEWRRIIQDSLDTQGATWLHHLHLAVGCMQDGTDTPDQQQVAEDHLMASLKLRPSVHAWRNLALLRQTQGNTTGAEWCFDQALVLALEDTAHTPQSVGLAGNVAAEYCDVLLARHRNVASLLHALPSTGPLAVILDIDRVKQCVVRHALDTKEPALALKLLATDFPSLSAGITLLVDMWYEAQYQLEQQQTQRPLTRLEQLHVRQLHPPPPSIDFRGAS